MPRYSWKNEKTGEEIELLRPMSESSTPPEEGNPEDWKRIYSVGIGRVEGAGGAPGRTVRVRKT